MKHTKFKLEDVVAIDIDTKVSGSMADCETRVTVVDEDGKRHFLHYKKEEGWRKGLIVKELRRILADFKDKKEVTNE